MKMFQVFWHDIKGIAKSPYMLLAVIAIMVIPLVYGGLYLAAFWDPYGHTERIPVGVVNLDEGYMYEDELKNYGDDVIDNLKHNDEIGWEFENDLDKANEGLVGDKYYALIILPKDFSKCLQQVEEGEFHRPLIKFVPNEKKNYITSLIIGKVSNIFQATVNGVVSNTFADKVFDEFYVVKDSIISGSEGTSMIEDGVVKLKSKIPALESGMDTLYEASDLFEDKMEVLYDGTNTLDDALEALKDKMPELTDGAEQLGEASNIFEDKLDLAFDGSRQLQDAVSTLKDQMPALDDGVTDLTDASKTVGDGLGQLKGVMPDFKDGVKQISNGIGTLEDGLVTAAESSDKIYSGATLLYSETEDLEDFLMEKAMNINSRLISKLKKYQKTLPLHQLIDVAILKVQKLNKTLDDLHKVQINYNPKEDDPEVINEEKERTLKEINTLAADYKNEIDDLLDSIEVIIDKIELPSGVNPKTEIGKTLLQAYDIIKDDLKGQDREYFNLANDLIMLEEARIGTEAMYLANRALYKGLDEDAVPGVKQLNEGMKLLEGKIPQLEDAVDSLQKGSGYLTAGITQLGSKVPDLEEGFSQLGDGTDKINDGLMKLHGSSEELVDGVNDLVVAAPDLSEGIDVITDSGKKLKDGALKLADSTTLLKDGIGVLNENMPVLHDGVDDLHDAVSTINDQMVDGSKLLGDKLTQDPNRVAAFMKEPVKLEKQEIYKVDNYGVGFTPYFISLALWVGALMMFFIISPKTDVEGAGSVSLMIGKYITYSLIGAFQAVILCLVVMKLGLKPDNVKSYILFGVLISLLSIAIMQTLIYLLEDIGRLLATVLLLLQLTSCGGAFQIELLPEFFQKVSPYMPFTYTVSGLREIISGPNPEVLQHDVKVLVLYWVAFAVLGVVLVAFKNHIINKKHNKPLKINNSKSVSA